MKLGTSDLVRVGQAVNACYVPLFLDRPERAVFPSRHDVIWGTDLDGPRPYGVIYWEEALKAFICALRGTDSTAEWISDARALLDPCPFLPTASTHRGFTRIYQSMRVDALSLGDELARIGRDKAPVIVTGHSLGAALATLAAADVGGVDLVTWAGPRVGDDRFAEMAASRLASNTRIVNTPDLVPNVPLRLFPAFPYMHVGVPMLLNSTGRVRDIPQAWHSLATYLHLLDPAQPLEPDHVPVSP